MAKKVSKRERLSFRWLTSVFKLYYYREPIPLDLFLKANILVDLNSNIALLWAAKSASLFSVKWFFAQKGLLDEALDFHPFVHNYRIKVYRYTDEYRRSLSAFMKDPNDFTVIKIVRHPLKRTVSSYVHTNKFNYADKQIAKLLDREINRKKRFSFREYIRYLGSVNIYKCNVHCRSQINPYELMNKIKVDRIIDLEQANIQLKKLEKEFSLKNTDLNKLAESKHHTQRTDQNDFCGDKIFNFKKRGLNYLPEAKYFYDDDLVNQVGTIYAEEFIRYEYECSLSQIS